MTKFKVGQKVRVVGHGVTWLGDPDLLPIGTICEVGEDGLSVPGGWMIVSPGAAHKFEAVADEPQADATKDAVLAFIKDHFTGEHHATQMAYSDMVRHLFGLDIRYVPETVEFVQDPLDTF